MVTVIGRETGRGRVEGKQATHWSSSESSSRWQRQGAHAMAKAFIVVVCKISGREALTKPESRMSGR